MSEKTVIIIGAGLAGLSAGCFARMNGYKARIFELHSLPGGVCTSWKRQGYVFDGCIHFLMGHRPGNAAYELYKTLGITDSCKFIDLPSYFTMVDESIGRSFAFTSDVPAAFDTLKSYSPGDARFFDELLAGSQALRGIDFFKMMEKPQEMIGVFDKLKMLWTMRSAGRYMSGKYKQRIDEYVKQFKDPWCRFVIQSLFFPQVPVWFIMMLLASLADNQLGYIYGGSLEFVKPIEKKFKDLGGEITYKAAVEEIIVKDNKAVGVRLADKSEHFAGIIISAADGHSTIFDMLGGKYVDDNINNMYKTWEMFPGAVMASYGVAKDYTDKPHACMLRLKKPFNIGGKDVDVIAVRQFDAVSGYAFPGKTGLQVECLAGDWEFWNNLVKDRRRYDVEKDRISKELLAILEPHYPGMSSAVEVTDVATPYTTWRYTRNHKGAFEGWLPAPEAISARVGKTLPGLGNFYMAGQWVAPGGGVTPCLFSGRQAIQLIRSSE